MSRSPLAASCLDTLVVELRDKGWSVILDFLEEPQWLSLLDRAQSVENYSPAGIGRGGSLQQNNHVRSDGIYWLDSSNRVDALWLALMDELRQAINHRLFLGLFEFECHYARYLPGSYYSRHLDAFKGQGIRIVSVVLYLNPQWRTEEGGELVIYPEEGQDAVRILPRGGTLAVFLSEDFPHEVLPATRTRFSIAGWFRMNMTTGSRLDPPCQKS